MSRFSSGVQMAELILFDCDGVLVDSEGPSNIVLAKNLSGHGLPMTPEDCEAQFIGGTMAMVGEKARTMGAQLPDDWIYEIYAQLYARLTEGVDVIAGIPGVLDRLEALGIPFCVCSNGSEEKMTITLGQTGLWNRFDGAIYSAHTLGVAKPDPDLYLIAAERHGVDPAHCVVIEDSLAGVTAAIRAGMRCLAYVAEGDGVRLSDQGAEIIRHMSEIPERVGL